MAEERRPRALGRQEDQPQEAAPAAPVVRKKKKLSKASIFFIFLLLAAGVGAGLHFSGMWDARPLVWSVVPQIPYIGAPVANFFGIPEQFTLTVAERRVFEQNERQRRLDEWERDLAEREAALGTTLVDIIARSEQLAGIEAAARYAALSAEDRDVATQEEIVRIRRDFTTMSARNAAQIAEELREDLAVEILQGMPNEARASILGRMDARRAARLVDLMSAQ